MKHKTAELTGAMLDAAVAKAEGRNIRLAGERWYVSSPGGFDTCEAGFMPSTNWAYGGPIIERERIKICPCYGGGWIANSPTNAHHVFCTERGDTALIAAMRAYVAHKLGDEVEL